MVNFYTCLCKDFFFNNKDKFVGDIQKTLFHNSNTPAFIFCTYISISTLDYTLISTNKLFKQFIKAYLKT